MDELEIAVEKVLSGDASSFHRVVGLTSKRLVRLSARIVGNVADAEDVVQEAYVKAYRSLVEGQFDRQASVQTWLYRIVTNASIDALRSRKRRPIATDALDTLPDSARGVSPEGRVALLELSSWLDELPEDQRAAIVLKAVEGFSSAEVAEILQCSEGAVEQRLVRARATLRKRSES